MTGVLNKPTNLFVHIIHHDLINTQSLPVVIKIKLKMYRVKSHEFFIHRHFLTATLEIDYPVILIINCY